MSEASQQAEPTMEEILASIRRIISEDSDQPAQGEGEPDEAAEGEQQMAQEAAMPEVEPEDEAPIEEPPPESDEVAADAEAEPESAVAPEEGEDADVLELTEVASEPADAPETIVSDEAASAASEKFHELSGLLVRRYPGSENTLEGLVRDMLRPMLKEWLDAHLPKLVEEMVAKEIARITGRSLK